jgi:hypothetical protein
MALYVVERDLSNVPAEQLRAHQREVASACLKLKSQGKRIRYISSSIVPADGRSLDLFGAESAEVVQEAHSAARIEYARIVEILDFTPTFVRRDISRPRQSVPGTIGAPADPCRAKRTRQAMTEHSAPELARWLADGQRFFRLCLETLESVDRLRSGSQALESENEILREEVVRLRHKADLLETARAEMIAAFNDLAGHVTQAVDHILQRSEDGETTK